ncbi:MAG: potassium channel family protein [Bacillota bacterium]
MFTVLLRYFKKFKVQIDPRTLLKMFLIGFVILMISAFIIMMVEPEGQFESIYDALWWGIVTATTVGYGDLYPVSPGGRIVAAVLMILGIGLLGGITATITDMFIKLEKRRELGQMIAQYDGHILICGWCDKTKEIILQILNEDMKDKQIVLVANIDRDPFPDNNLVHFVRGKIDDAEILKKAGVESARTAIILNEDNNDATTVLSALTVNSLNPTIYSVAEISKSENKIHLQNASVDDIIINNHINSRLMVRTALYNGTSQIFGELLSNHTGNEIYMTKVSNDFINKAFIELFTFLKNEKDTIVLGLKRKDSILVNPSKEELIQQGDKVVYISTSKIKF